MSNFLYYLAAFAVVLGVLIVVHEYGHYRVARLCGVKVLRFSVGFGRPLWQRRFGQMAPNGQSASFLWADTSKCLTSGRRLSPPRNGIVPSTDSRSGAAASSWQRGRAANFLLALFPYWGIFWSGTNELRPIVGTPPAASAAAAAGFVNGERVLRVGDTDVLTWKTSVGLCWRAVDESSADLEVINERRKSSCAGWIFPEYASRAGRVTPSTGSASRSIVPKVPPVACKVVGGGVADLAGMRVETVSKPSTVNSIDHWSQVVGIVRASAGQGAGNRRRPRRQQLRLRVTPELHEEKGAASGGSVSPSKSGLPVRS